MSRLAAFSSRPAAWRRCPSCPEGEPGRTNIGTSTLGFVQRPGLGHAQQPPRRLERARLDLGRSHGQGPRRPAARSSVSAAARSRNAAAAARPPRWPGRPNVPVRRPPACRRAAARRGRDPRPPVGVGVRIGRLRPMPGALPAGHRQRPPGRPRSGPGDERSAPVRPARSARRPRQLPRRGPGNTCSPAARHNKVTSPVGSAAAVSSNRCACRGSARNCPEKAGLDAADQRPRSGSQKPPASSAQPARGQLQQRQRVAAGLGDDPVAHLRVRLDRRPPRPATCARRHRQPIMVPTPAQPQLIVVVRLARGGGRWRPARPAGGGPRTPGTAPRPGPATARHRPGRPAAGLPPWRPAASTASPTREPIRRRALPHAERDRERVALRSGAASTGRASARTAGAARRTPAPSRTPPPARTTPNPTPAGRIIQQRRLPDPGLAAHDQHGAATPRA